MRTNLTFWLVAVVVSFGCAGGGEPLVTVEKDLTPDKVAVDASMDATSEIIAVDASMDVPEVVADLPCLTTCGAKECGDDGCGGNCGVCTGDLVCSEAGICEAVDCSGKPYTIAGVFVTSVEEFAFDAVEVAVSHKVDVDPEEDGCIARVEVDLRRGTGCSLHVLAVSSFGANGGLRVQEFTLQVDSQCPGFSDALEGLYEDTGDLDLAEVEMDDLELAVDNVQEWCFPSSLTLHLSGTVYSLDAGAQIDILPTSITIKGSFLSVGDETLSCPCEPSCGGKKCGGDGCGGSCGTCPDGYYCSQGACVEGECVPDCEGKECGPNGCDGTCGDCVEGYYCDQGICKEGECAPECEGKECGPNGCGGICGNCGCGEVCEGAACTFHACDGKFCGNDGCGGECGTCGEGLACSNGTCVNAGCQAQPLALDGDFNTVVSAITFDSVAANVVHKRDVDEWEDGCIASVVLTFKKGLGCALMVVAGESFDLDGHLQVQQVSFSADSQCPGFPDDKEGTYSGVSDLASVWLDLGVNEVPGYDVEESCLNTAMKLHLEGTLHGGAPGKTLQILQTELSISGDFKSFGDYAVSCPCQPSCVNTECGSAGCGFVCGSCTCGESCDEGTCVFHGCDGKECGDDGCGATCGNCAAGTSCLVGLCQVVCGDGQCGAGEDLCNCPADCTDGCAGCCQGTVCKTGNLNSECGNNGAACASCSGGQSCDGGQCVVKCGDGQCGGGEDKCNCPGDCTGGCAGCCQGTECKAGTIDGECGKNGAACATCAGGTTCQAGQCQVVCGDGQCGAGEDQCNCPADCMGGCAGCCQGTECKAGTVDGECGKNGAVCTACGGGTTCQSQACEYQCGDGACGELGGETCATCLADCGCDPDLEECVQATTGGWICTAKMVSIPAGNFWMGCNNCDGSTVNDTSCFGPEHPYHEVYLDAYEIDKTEVTSAQYAKCEAAGGCSPADTKNYPQCTWQKPGMGGNPINCVTWYQIEDYCLWAGKMLCTEARWEKGARGGCEENGGPSNCKAQSRKYPWGNNAPTCDLALKDGCEGDTQPVCSRSPAGDSPYGLCDMAGNVQEWVADKYQKDYYCDGSAASGDEYCAECGSWPGSPTAWSNPEGPESSSWSVRRGGSFGYGDAGLRVSSRGSGNPSSVDSSVSGGRCCRPK